MTDRDLASLFEYPDENYMAALRACGLSAGFEGLSLEKLQEAFIQAFDLNPDAALDIGWHLYGENYERGEFLLKMRSELRRFGLAESRELPDHMTHVLRVLFRMDEDERSRFAESYLQPALSKIAAALEKAGSPFVNLLRAVEGAISSRDHRGVELTEEVTYD